MQGFITGFDSSMDFVKAFLRAVLTPITAFCNIFSNIWVGAVFIIILFAILLALTAKKYGKDFMLSIKRPQTLAVCAMLIALNVVLGYFSIDVTAYLRIGFGFITLPVVTVLFGPLAGCASGMLQDIVSFIIKPTGGYLFTLTLNVGISGMIYGLMLYKKKITFARILLTKLVIITVVNIILNSIGLAPTVGSGLIGILPSRIIKNLLLLPIQSVIVYVLLKATKSRVKLHI